jgi:hypothetical protein
MADAELIESLRLAVDRNLRRMLVDRLRRSPFVRRSAILAVVGNAVFTISLVVWSVVLLRRS